MSPGPIWKSVAFELICLVILVFLSALKMGAEMLSVSRLERLAEEGDGRASKALGNLGRYREAEGALQCGILMVLLLSGLLGGLTLAVPLAERWAWPLPAAGAAVLLALFLVFAPLGVLLPRRLTEAKGEARALALLSSIRFFALPLIPLWRFVRASACALAKLSGVDADENRSHVTEDEIMAMVDEGEEKGAIEANEKEMIENIFEFNNMAVEDCMTHRTDITFLRKAMEPGEVLELIEQTGKSRFPVYDGDVDNVIGIVTARDFLLSASRGFPVRRWQSLIRPAYFVPESMRTDVLFREMQKRKSHMAIVVDEYGGTSGLVTMEDLLEEIVGNIYDEYDQFDENDIVPVGEGRWRVEGTVELERLGAVIGVELPDDEEYDTLGGLVFSQLTAVPDNGSHPEVSCFGLTIRVDQMNDRRVEWATVERPMAAQAIAE